MASSPPYKVYDSRGHYQASAHEPHAAAILAHHYEGTVRCGHKRVVWTSGEISPHDSLDRVTQLIDSRNAAAARI